MASDDTTFVSSSYPVNDAKCKHFVNNGDNGATSIKWQCQRDFWYDSGTQ